MLKTLLFSVLIIAIALAFMAVKVIARRGGRISSMHIHDSPAMRQRGIHCVIDQDREARQQKRIKEKTDIKK